jgi:uncharacterized membrane protein
VGVTVGLALGGLVVVSLLLRITALHAAFWIDEGLSVGIASHGFLDIPGVLRLDGSPPLYYLVLHVWMSVFGDGQPRRTCSRWDSPCWPSRWPTGRWRGCSAAGRGCTPRS